MGAVIVVVFAAAIAAFALSNGSQPGGQEPTTLKTAGSDDSSDGLGGEVTAVEEGNPFPAFSLTEADGRTLTNASLKGKPSIVWFTTSYCVPCQQGAALVSDLDDELGGDAFDVLVVFVDPSEPRSALTSWRDRFANDDWLVALDDGTLSEKVGLRYLVVKGVPARVCDNCGEEYIDEEITDELLKFAEEALSRGVEIDVSQYVA